MKTPRITKRRIRCAVATAEKHIGVKITEDTARKIIAWDIDDEFVSELQEDGHMDTYCRDYFFMALAELIPGKPTVKDGLFSDYNAEHWHWPANGSSPAYNKAFSKAFKQLLKKT